MVASRTRRPSGRAPDPRDRLVYVHGGELVVIGSARAAARELGIELDAEDERIHDADRFQALRVAPDELPAEPLCTGRVS